MKWIFWLVRSPPIAAPLLSDEIDHWHLSSDWDSWSLDLRYYALNLKVEDLGQLSDVVHFPIIIALKFFGSFHASYHSGQGP